MAFDPHANLASSLVVTPPSPDASGVTLTVSPGQGALFPNPSPTPFNCTVCPFNTFPTPSNSEIVRVTAIVGDTFTVMRAQEGTTAKEIAAGWMIANSITAKTLTDIEASVEDCARVSEPNVFEVFNEFRDAINVTAQIAILRDTVTMLGFGLEDGSWRAIIRHVEATRLLEIGYDDGAFNPVLTISTIDGSVMAYRPIKPPAYTVGALPAAASLEGATAYVTDANATTRLSVAAGSGSNKVMVFSDGANWLIL